MIPAKKLLIIIVALAGIFFISTLIFYHVTYDHPIIIGDLELVEKYREDCLRYSHELMADCLVIPAHAQIIDVREGKGGIIIILTSFLPPSRTKVWHSEVDVPYWEVGF